MPAGGAPPAPLLTPAPASAAPSASEPALDPEIARAFFDEEMSGARLGFLLRLIAIVLIAAVAAARAAGFALAWYLGLLAILALTGWLTLAFLRRAGPGRAPRWRLAAGAMIALEMAVLTGMLVGRSPAMAESWPLAMNLRLGNTSVLFVFLGLAALTASPGLALWAGVAAAAAWIGGTAWLLSREGMFTALPGDFSGMSMAEALAVLLHPDYVSVTARGQEAFLMLVLAMILAAAARRARRLALRQAEAAEGRARLARYFSPDIAARLAREPGDLTRVRRAEATILFADVVGFSGHAERLGPEGTLAFLREFHAIATAAVFSNGGTLHKFIGDEIMASFGALEDDAEAPARGLACAREIVRETARWSAAREAAGAEPVRVGVGLHHGAVVVGDIGDSRCLELAVLGDTVNVASRLERETRPRDAHVAASQAVLEGAAAARGAQAAAGFGPRESLPLRGREKPLACAFWRLPDGAPALPPAADGL